MTKTGYKFDFIFDAVGKSSFNQGKTLLTQTGIYISTEIGKNVVNLFHEIISRFIGGKKLLFPIPYITKEDIVFLRELVPKRKFEAIIDR